MMRPDATQAHDSFLFGKEASEEEGAHQGCNMEVCDNATEIDWDAQSRKGAYHWR